MTHSNPKPPFVVGIGEVLWDVFPTKKVFGGAPGNFAVHSAQLGSEAIVVSSIGNDELGNAAIAALNSRGVNTDFVQTCEFPTGTVAVRTPADGQQSYEISQDVAWDSIVWNQQLKQLAKSCDVVCFGTLAQRSEPSSTTIRNFLKATDSDCLRVCDVNLRPPFYNRDTILTSLELANLLKVNEEEFPIVLSAADTGHLERNAGLAAIAQKYNLKFVILTRGANGSVIYSNGNFSEYYPRESIEVQDTVGAGDAFLATVVCGILNGWTLDFINRSANSVAGFVCTQTGATPQLPDK